MRSPLPVASMVMAPLPEGRGFSGTRTKAPSSLATVLPISCPSSLTTTSAPGCSTAGDHRLARLLDAHRVEGGNLLFGRGVLRRLRFRHGRRFGLDRGGLLRLGCRLFRGRLFVLRGCSGWAAGCSAAWGGVLRGVVSGVLRPAVAVLSRGFSRAAGFAVRRVGCFRCCCGPLRLRRASAVAAGFSAVAGASAVAAGFSAVAGASAVAAGFSWVPGRARAWRRRGRAGPSTVRASIRRYRRLQRWPGRSAPKSGSCSSCSSRPKMRLAGRKVPYQRPRYGINKPTSAVSQRNA